MPVNFSFAPSPLLRGLPHLQLCAMQQLAALATLPASDDPTNGELARAADAIDEQPSRGISAPGVIFVITNEGVPGIGQATYTMLLIFGGTYYEVTVKDGNADGGYVVQQVKLVSSARGAMQAARAMPTNRPNSNTPANVSLAQMQSTYANNPNPAPVYANNPAAQSPYANNPMAQNPYANNPMIQNPYANNPMAQNPYANNPASGARPTITRSGLSNLLARTRARLGG